MQEQDGGGKEGGERMVWLDWFVVDIAIVGEARCSPHVFAFFGGGYFFFNFVVFLLPKTIAFLPVIPVAPNTVIVWDPCDERPPNPVDALGRAKARKVLRNAIGTFSFCRGAKENNLGRPRKKTTEQRFPWRV